MYGYIVGNYYVMSNCSRQSFVQLVLSSDPTLSQRNWSSESSRISWASAHSCDTISEQCSKHFVPNPLNKGTGYRVEINNVVRKVLHNNYPYPVGVAFYAAYLSWDWMGTWMVGGGGEWVE